MELVCFRWCLNQMLTGFYEIQFDTGLWGPHFCLVEDPSSALQNLRHPMDTNPRNRISVAW